MENTINTTDWEKTSTLIVDFLKPYIKDIPSYYIGEDTALKTRLHVAYRENWIDFIKKHDIEVDHILLQYVSHKLAAITTIEEYYYLIKLLSFYWWITHKN